jgi:hypothetical protein
MKIFADHCVHNDVVEMLRSFGFRVQKASEVNLEKSSDEEIFNYPVKTKQVLLTFDKDFGNIIRFNIRKSAGVVIFYIKRGMKKQTILQRVAKFFSRPRKFKGTLFVIDEAGRIKTWPRKTK